MLNLKKLRMNELIFGLILLIIGLVITTIGGFKANDGWNKIKENKEKVEKDSTTFKVESENQSGGITAGQIGTVNISLNQETNNEQLKRDSQVAFIYQTEIVHFLVKFKTCLRWSLPIGDRIEKEIDEVFKYGEKFTEGIEIEKITKELMVKIFTNYEFRKIMPYFYTDSDFKPTGYNNLLGIMSYLDSQLEKHLNKYGSNISVELSNKIEYTQRMIQSEISSIKLDLNVYSTTSLIQAENISKLFVLLRDEYTLIREKYTKDMTGGFPIAVGKITKVHETDGELTLESQFSDYIL